MKRYIWTNYEENCLSKNEEQMMHGVYLCASYKWSTLRELGISYTTSLMRVKNACLFIYYIL